MFTRKAKPIRILGDPDGQSPDKWSLLYLKSEGPTFPTKGNLLFVSLIRVI